MLIFNLMAGKQRWVKSLVPQGKPRHRHQEVPVALMLLTCHTQRTADAADTACPGWRGESSLGRIYNLYYISPLRTCFSVLWDRWEVCRKDFCSYWGQRSSRGRTPHGRAPGERAESLRERCCTWKDPQTNRGQSDLVIWHFLKHRWREPVTSRKTTDIIRCRW